MVLCNKKHSEIVHGNGTCPLCNLTEHNNLVHDFIESKGRDLVNELVLFLNSKNSELSEVQNQAPTTAATKLNLIDIVKNRSNYPTKIITESTPRCARVRQRERIIK